METLSNWRTFGYATLAVPMAMLMMQLIVYLPPFYATVTGLDIATVGFVFLLARAWDAVIDPAIGYMSDRTNSPLGRRKPWILVGVPLLLIGVHAFLQPPDGVSTAYLFVTALCFYVALTMVQIPYLSMAAEVARGYHARTRIVSVREAGTMVGNLLATSVPLIVLAGMQPSLREILDVFANALYILLPLAAIAVLFSVPTGQPASTTSFATALRVIPSNGPLRRLLIGTFLLWLGGSVYNALVLFVVEAGLGLPSGGFLWLVFVQYVFGLAGLPLWLWVARRWSRHRALAIGGLAFLGSLPVLFLFPGTGLVAVACVFAALGIVSSVIWVMPPALVSDTIEFGMWRGLGDDAALYMALYHFAHKMAAAVGVGLALPLAGLAGFAPGTENTAQSVNNMMIVALCLPGLIAIPGAWLLWTHRLTPKTHEWIRQRLIRRGKLAEQNS